MLYGAIDCPSRSWTHSLAVNSLDSELIEQSNSSKKCCSVPNRSLELLMMIPFQLALCDGARIALDQLSSG